MESRREPAIGLQWHCIYLQTALFSDDTMFSLGGIAGCLRFLCISENVT